MKKVIIYLSGPISGLDYEDAKERFEIAENRYKKILGGNVKVYNPMKDPDNMHTYAMMEKCLITKSEAWKMFMRNCIGWLVKCDSIVMLEGWEDSRGATEERRIAMMLGMTVHYNYGIRDLQIATK